MLDVTQKLADFVSGYESSQIPAKVRQQAVRSFVNWMGCSIGGSQHPAVSKAMEALAPFIGQGHASVIGRHEKVDALHASLFNGISSHVLDFDDTHLATLVHPSGPVISALFALAECQTISGNDFIDAIILGVDMECRVARGVCPEHYDRGWHVTSTAGVFGAAAAVGRALKLDAQKMSWAFGIAATQASGLREMFGSMTKSMHPGHAAQCGMRSALLAQVGFTSSTKGIEAPRGFAHVLSTKQDFESMVEGLGSEWLISENSFKPYACGLVIHPVIDGCINIRKLNTFELTDIQKVSLRVNPLVMELTGKKQPTTGLEGKFSVHHSAAIVLTDGMSSMKHYSDAAVMRPEVRALRECVEVRSQADVRIDEAFVDIECRDGRKISHHVKHALGSVDNPMTDENLNQKFNDLSSDWLGTSKTMKIQNLCWETDRLTDVGGQIGGVLSI